VTALSFRSRLALLMTALSVVSLAAVVTAVSASAASAQCSTSTESRQPVLLVHGYNSGPETWNADTRNGYASVSGTCIDVFDYKNWSTHWVTDSHIGPALATRIDQLATASAAGGGSGKVIIVAHSMGGLATRCAVAESCNGGKSDVKGHLRELITFGTPNTGTWLRGTGLGYGALGGASSLLSGACYASFNGANPICEQIRALLTSSATKAFTPGSTQLNGLPSVPAKIPVFAVAAHVEAVTSLFGWQSVDIGDAGDLIVKENSALDEGVRYGKLGGVQTIDCGKVNVLRVSGENCNHVTETNDGRFIDAAMKQIKLAEQPAPRKTTPTTTQAPAPVQHTTQAPPPPTTSVPPVRQAGAYTPGSPFDDYCVINWPTAPIYTSDSIQMVMGCAHVDGGQFFYTAVIYGDPNLKPTPSTGPMHVVGTVIDVATSAYGYRVLEVQAKSISF
jgi:pimeloyl-ACP methyl ester carboxylesterase